MDYKFKYLKYKHKYLKLSKQFNQSNKLEQLGGVETSIPHSHPNTYSFLFMPLIYYTIDRNSVRMIDDFENIVNECITNLKSMLPDIVMPFNNFENFIIYLGSILNSNRIITLLDIELLKDGDHHISGKNQEIVTNYKTNEAINSIISCLAIMLIERHSGEKFIYLK